MFSLHSRFLTLSVYVRRSLSGVGYVQRFGEAKSQVKAIQIDCAFLLVLVHFSDYSSLLIGNWGCRRPNRGDRYRCGCWGSRIEEEQQQQREIVLERWRQYFWR